MKSALVYMRRTEGTKGTFDRDASTIHLMSSSACLAAPALLISIPSEIFLSS